MQKQRNSVDRAPQELAEQLKVALAKNVYAMLKDMNVDRQKMLQIVSMVNSTVDDVSVKYAKHFHKNVEDLIAASQTGVQRQDSKS